MWSTTTAVSPVPTRQPSARLQGAHGVDTDSDSAIRNTLARVRMAAPTNSESLERTIHHALAAQRAEAAAEGQPLAPEDAWLTLFSAIAVHEHRYARAAVASG